MLGKLVRFGNYVNISGDTMTGNLGIGVAPSEILHVRGGNVTGIRIDTTGNASVLDFYSQGGGSNRNFSIRSNYNTSGNIEILRSTAAGGAPTTNVATISTGGNFGVGHGSGTPSSLFHVLGAIATAFAAKTSNYTVTATDSVLSGDCTSGNLTFTRPAAASIAGRRYTFKRIDGSGNSVIVDGNSSETIDGAATKTLTTQWAAITIISNGTNWLIESQMGTIT
jgi:hypothetical protein